MKVCNRCGKEKKKDEFSTQPQNKDGLRGECRVGKFYDNQELLSKALNYIKGDLL